MTGKPRLIDALEDEAIEQVKEIAAFRSHRSGRTADEYRLRAKIAIGVIGGYVRLRGTIANERSNELIAERMRLPMPPPQIGGAE